MNKTRNQIFQMYDRHLMCTDGVKRTITLSKQINKFILAISQLSLLYLFMLF